MKWNYRVVENIFTTCYDILEVYYDSDGFPTGWVAASVTQWGDRDDLVFTLKMMLEACDKPNLVLLEDGTLKEKE